MDTTKRHWKPDSAASKAEVKPSPPTGEVAREEGAISEDPIEELVREADAVLFDSNHLLWREGTEKLLKHLESDQAREDKV